MSEPTSSTTLRLATALAPVRECPKPDTYFDGIRWRCQACTWVSPREETVSGR